MPQMFANLEGLARLSHNEGVDIRRPLLRVLTDLYILEKTHTREEEQQFVVLALRLIPAVDATTRTAVARKLAAYPLTPTPILEALVREDPSLATILNSGTRSIDPDPPPFKEPAAERPERATVSSHSLTHAAAPDVPERDETPTPSASEGAASLGERFLAADPEEREFLLAELDQSDIEFNIEMLGLPSRPGAARRLERAALQRNHQEFARELQLSLGISGRVAWRVTRDETGETVLVAAKALGIREEVFLRIVLFLNARIGESVERVFALMRLYEQCPPEAAVPIVASWREQATAIMGAQFRPLHAVDGAPAGAAREGTPTWRRTPADQIGRRVLPSELKLSEPRQRG